MCSKCRHCFAFFEEWPCIFPILAILHYIVAFFYLLQARQVQVAVCVMVLQLAQTHPTPWLVVLQATQEHPAECMVVVQAAQAHPALCASTSFPLKANNAVLLQAPQAQLAPWLALQATQAHAAPWVLTQPLQRQLAPWARWQLAQAHPDEWLVVKVLALLTAELVKEVGAKPVVPTAMHVMVNKFIVD